MQISQFFVNGDIKGVIAFRYGHWSCSMRIRKKWKNNMEDK